MLSIALGALAAIAWPAAAAAQASPPASPDAADASANASLHLGLQQVQAGFIRRDPKAASLFSLGLTKNGQQVSTNLFTLIPTETVLGSEEAARHLRHARIFQGFTVGLAATAIGLIVSAVAVRGDDRDSVRTSNLLLSGALASAFLELACAAGRDTELFLAVNAYNWDLVNGRLGR